MASDRIGVLGGYGAVGSAVVRALATEEICVRVGGRQRTPAERLLADVGVEGEAMPTDLNDDAALAAFCEGCRVVVSCAGASSRVGDKVARAAIGAGADYVDPGGDEALRAQIDARGRIAIVGAGMMPGLTGLLLRWLAARTDARPTSLIVHAGTHDHFSPAAALDYVASLRGGYGDAQAALRGGVKQARALVPRLRTEIPFFPGRVDAYPYLTHESERVAGALGLGDVEWYNVIDGAHTMSVVARLQTGSSGGDEEAARAIAHAAKLDLLGRSPYQIFVVCLADHKAREQTLVVRAESAYVLSGTVAAWAVTEILTGRVRPGAWFVDEALDPSVVERLRGAVSLFELIDERASAIDALHEGEL